MIQMTGVGNSPTVFSNFEPVVKSSNSPGGIYGEESKFDPPTTDMLGLHPARPGGMKPRKESGKLFFGSKAVAF